MLTRRGWCQALMPTSAERLAEAMELVGLEPTTSWVRSAPGRRYSARAASACQVTPVGSGRLAEIRSVGITISSTGVGSTETRSPAVRRERQPSPLGLAVGSAWSVTSPKLAVKVMTFNAGL